MKEGFSEVGASINTIQTGTRNTPANLSYHALTYQGKPKSSPIITLRHPKTPSPGETTWCKGAGAPSLPVISSSAGPVKS